MQVTKECNRFKFLLRVVICVSLVALLVLVGMVMASAEEADPIYSEGLSFTYDGCGTCFVSGIGSCQDTEINIPPVSPNGWRVTCIGNGAFRNCSKLKSVIIPEGVACIDSSAFSGCSSLSSLRIPESVMSIGAYAFYGCSSLSSLRIPESVTSIGSYAFYGCSSISSLRIPASMMRIDSSAFRNCRGLTSIIVDKDNPVYHSNDNCLIQTSSKELVLGCQTSVIPVDGSVTSIGSYAFYGCSSISSLHIPEGVTSIGTYAFRSCKSLVSLTIPSTVTYVEFTSFYGCDNLIQKEDGVHYVDRWVVFAEKDITQANLREGTVGIAGSAFYQCTKLESIDIPDSILYIGNCAFYDCWSLTSIILPDGLKNIEASSFYYCYSLIHVDLPENLEKIGSYAFSWCALTNIEIPDTVTSIYPYAFESCGSIKSINIPKNVQYIAATAFRSCTGLKNIVIPVGVTEIKAGMFANCKELEDIYYLGTEEEWSGVEIWPYNNGNLPNATVHIMGTEQKITGVSLSLGDSLAMNYYAKVNPMGGTVQMRFIIDGVKTYVDGIYDEASGEYVFSLTGITPQQMGSNITANLIVVTENGTRVIVARKPFYSIRQYCDDALAADPENRALATLLADLLAYGDAAQIYTGCDKDHLVSDGFEVAPSEWQALTDTDFVLSEKASEDCSFTAAGVHFDYINRIYFKITVADVTGVTVTVNGRVYTAEDLTLVADTNNTYVFYTDGIYSTEFDRVFTAELAVNGEVVQTVSYSVKSYVFAKQNSENERIAKLVQALYNYGRSSIAYIENQ